MTHLTACVQISRPKQGQWCESLAISVKASSHLDISWWHFAVMWCRKLQTFFICDFSYAGPAMCLWFPIIAKISWISHPPALLLSSLRLTLAYTLITFHSPPCVFLSSNFNLYLLSSPFVSSKPSHNLPGLCSSLSSFLFLYFKPAVKSFGKARFSSLLFYLFIFFRPELSSFSLPALLCILHPPPPTPNPANPPNGSSVCRIPE